MRELANKQTNFCCPDSTAFSVTPLTLLQHMADLPRLHAQATRLILSLREGLERLEAAEVCEHPPNPDIS